MHTYIKKGNNGKPYKQNEEAFEIIRKRSKKTGKKEIKDVQAFKDSPQNEHVWFGQLFNENGTITERNIIDKQHFVFDIESKSGKLEFDRSELDLLTEQLERFEFHYIVVHSHGSNMKENKLKVHIFIETKDPIPADQYEVLYETFRRTYLPQTDPSFFDSRMKLVSQTVSLPRYNPNMHNDPEIPFFVEKNKGKPFDHTTLLDSDIFKSVQRTITLAKEFEAEQAKKATANFKTQLEEDQIIEWFDRWINQEGMRERLALSGGIGEKAMIQIKAWKYADFISKETAESFMIELANGNLHFEESNLRELEYSNKLPKKPEPPEQFLKVIEPRPLPEEPYPIPEEPYTPSEILYPKSERITWLRELKTALYNKGLEWIEKHTERDDNGEPLNSPTLNPRTIADILLSTARIGYIEEGDADLSKLVIYDPSEGIYTSSPKFIKQLILSVNRGATRNQCNEVIHFLEVDAREIVKTESETLFIVGNGVFDTETKELMPFTPELVFTSKVKTEYNPTIEEPVFSLPDGGQWKLSEWIHQLADGDQAKERNLYRIFRHAIDTNNVSDITAWLYSPKGKSGKSTYQNIVSNLVGKSNTVSLKIHEFEQDFKLAQAYGKSLIIGDDNNPKTFSKTSETYKSVSTGELVSINQKGEKIFTTRLTPFIIQSMNGIPKFADTTDGFTRRILVFVFGKSFTDNGSKLIKTTFIKDKRLLQWVLKTALEIDESQIEFEKTAESEEIKKGLIHDNNPVALFADEVVSQLLSERLTPKFLFHLFLVWCESENNPTQYKQKTFTNELKTILNDNGWKVEKGRTTAKDLSNNEHDAKEIYGTLKGEITKYSNHLEVAEAFKLLQSDKPVTNLFIKVGKGE